MVDKQQQKGEEKHKWIFGISGAIFITIGLFNAYFRVFLENFSALYYDTYWFDGVYGAIGDWMCCILIAIGFLTTTMASKSRSTSVLIILLPSMLGLIGICTYSSVISLNLLDPIDANYYPRYITSFGEKRTSFNTSWDTMMKSVMNCGGTLEEDATNSGVIYLCTKEDRWNGCYSNYDSNYCSRCQVFSLDQNDFCNGV